MPKLRPHREFLQMLEAEPPEQREALMSEYTRLRDSELSQGRNVPQAEPIDASKTDFGTGMALHAGGMLKAGAAVGRAIQKPFEAAGHAVGEATTKALIGEQPATKRRTMVAEGAGMLTGGAIEYAPAMLPIPGLKAAGVSKLGMAVGRALKSGTQFGTYDAATELAKQVTGESEGGGREVLEHGGVGMAAGTLAHGVLAEAIPAALRGAMAGGRRAGASVNRWADGRRESFRRSREKPLPESIPLEEHPLAGRVEDALPAPPPAVPKAVPGEPQIPVQDLALQPPRDIYRGANMPPEIPPIRPDLPKALVEALRQPEGEFAGSAQNVFRQIPDHITKQPLPDPHGSLFPSKTAGEPMPGPGMGIPEPPPGHVAPTIPEGASSMSAGRSEVMPGIDPVLARRGTARARGLPPEVPEEIPPWARPNGRPSAPARSQAQGESAEAAPLPKPKAGDLAPEDIPEGELFALAAEVKAPPPSEKLTFKQFFETRTGQPFDRKTASQHPEYHNLKNEWSGQHLPEPTTQREELQQAIDENLFIAATGQNRLGQALPAAAKGEHGRWAMELQGRLKELNVVEAATGIKAPPIAKPPPPPPLTGAIPRFADMPPGSVAPRPKPAPKVKARVEPPKPPELVPSLKEPELFAKPEAQVEPKPPSGVVPKPKLQPVQKPEPGEHPPPQGQGGMTASRKRLEAARDERRRPLDEMEREVGDWWDKPVVQAPVKGKITDQRKIGNDIEAINTLSGPAPRYAQLRGKIENGDVSSHVDLSSDITKAAATIADLQANNTTVKKWLKQVDPLDAPAEEHKLLVEFFDRSKGTRQAADMFDDYASVVEKMAKPKQGGLFGDAEPPSKLSLLEVAIDKHRSGMPKSEIPLIAEKRNLHDAALKRIQEIEAERAGWKAAGDFSHDADLLAEIGTLKLNMRPVGGGAPLTAAEVKARIKAVIGDSGEGITKEGDRDINRMWAALWGPEYALRNMGGPKRILYQVARLYQKANGEKTRLRDMYLTRGRTGLTDPKRMPKDLRWAWGSRDVGQADWVPKTQRSKVVSCLRGRCAIDSLEPEGRALVEKVQAIRGSRAREYAIRTLETPQRVEGWKPVWQRLQAKGKAQEKKVNEALWDGDLNEKFQHRDHTNAELKELGIGPEGIEAYHHTHEKLKQFLEKVINPLRKSQGLKPLEGRQNYLPHKWLGQWELRTHPTPENPHGAVIFTKRGNTFETEHEALTAAYEMLAEDATQKFILKPSFAMRNMMESVPDSAEARALARIFGTWEKAGVVDSHLINMAREAGIKVRGFPSHMEKRKGTLGYNKDELPKVLELYFSQGARYIAMRKARAQASHLLSQADAQAYPKAMQFVQKFIDDIHGVETAMEGRVDDLLKKIPVLGSLLGMRPTRAATRTARTIMGHAKLGLLNTSFAAVNMTQFITHAAPLLGPTYAARGVMRGIKAMNNLWSHRKFGTPLNTEGRLLLRFQKQGIVDPAFLHAEAPGGLESFFGKGFYFGQKAEMWNRTFTSFAAYARLAEKGARVLTKDELAAMAKGPRGAQQVANYNAFLKGMQGMGIKPGSKLKDGDISTLLATNFGQDTINFLSRESMMEHTKRLNELINFQYDIAAKPEIFRGPFGELVGQFKQFGTSTIQMWGLLNQAGKQMKRKKGIAAFNPLMGHFGAAITLSGSMGFAFAFLLDDTFRLVSQLASGGGPGYSPIDYMLEHEIPDVVARGLPALAGIDTHRRIGYGDLIPTEAKDLMGATINTLYDTIQSLSQGNYSQIVRDIAPGIGNPIEAIRTGMSGVVSERGMRKRNRYIPTEGEIAARFLGFRPLYEVKQADRIRLTKQRIKRYKHSRASWIDAAVEIVNKYEGPDRSKMLKGLAEDARGAGVRITKDDIVREVRAKRTPQAFRVQKQIPKALRRELIPKLRPFQEEQRRRQKEAVERARH